MTHKQISYIKSGIRIAGYALLPLSILAAALVLFASELVGIAEEWGERGERGDPQEMVLYGMSIKDADLEQLRG